MGARGPARSCECEDVVRCMVCRRREQQRRYSQGLPRLERLPKGVRDSRLRLPLTAVDLAYLAGLFDGEGCLTRANGRPVIQIGMTDRDVIEYLTSLGGTMREEHPPGNRRPLYRWRLLARREVIEFLDAVLPYLRVKRDDASARLLELRESEERMPV